MAGERATAKAKRTLLDVARYVLGIGVGAVVLLLLLGKRGEFLAAWHQLRHVSIAWVAAAVAAEALSLGTFAYLQHRVLRLSGASIPMPGTVDPYPGQ